MGFRSTHQRLVQINQPPLFTWLRLKFPAEQCSLSSIVTVRNTALHPLKYQKSTFYSLCQIMAKWGSSQEAALVPLKDFVETGSLLSKAQSSRPKVRAPSADGFCLLRVRKATSSQVQTLLNSKKPRITQDSNPRFESRDESVSNHEPWFIKHFLRRGNKTIHDGILQPEKRMINWSMFAIHGSNRKVYVRGLRPEKMISQQTLSEPQWWKYSDFVTLELDTYSELTWLRSRRSRTVFLRDLLHPLVCIFVVQNNEFSPTSKVYKNFFRPKEHQRVQLSSTVTWPQTEEA